MKQRQREVGGRGEEWRGKEMRHLIRVERSKGVKMGRGEERRKHKEVRQEEMRGEATR